MSAVEYVAEQQPDPRFPPETQILRPATWQVTTNGRVLRFPADSWPRELIEGMFSQQEDTE